MDPLVHLEVVLEPGAHPPVGWLLNGDGTRRPFSGWLELMALVERLSQQPDPEGER